jgi:ribulose kinase
MLAAAGVKAFVDVSAAAAAMSHDSEEILPVPAHQELYESLFARAYRPLYAALRDITHAISALELEGRWTMAEAAVQSPV